MFPTFPSFKRLELSDKQEFEAFVKKFEPYSDFNFVSLWSYNTEDDFELSLLNGNLVLKMNNYITLKPFYTFLGTQQISQTISTLLDFSKSQNLVPEIRLIPEINVQSELNSLSEQFDMKEDPDNFDYVYDLDEFVVAEGGKYKVLRNMISKFTRTTESFLCSLADLQDEQVKNQIIELVHEWGEAKDKDEEEIQNELISINRLLSSSAHLNLTCLCLFIDEKLKAFFISEKIDDEYGLAHFRKADPSIPGIFQFIDYENAKHLKQLGCKYLNYEQDLGIPGMRKSKQSLNPVKFLKKYTIQRLNTVR